MQSMYVGMYSTPVPLPLPTLSCCAIPESMAHTEKSAQWTKKWRFILVINAVLPTRFFRINYGFSLLKKAAANVLECIACLLSDENANKMPLYLAQTLFVLKAFIV